MGWFQLLRVLPWGAMLANGPAIARAAEGLLSRSRRDLEEQQQRRAELDGLADRIVTLEARQVELAALVQQLADQAQRMAEAQALLAARLRWLLTGTIAALVLAVIAVLVVMRT